MIKRVSKFHIINNILGKSIMKLSTKTRYGLRIMIDLAAKNAGQPIHLSEIAKRQCLSDKYLEQIIAILKSADLVVSVRGAKGGYYLSRAASAITALDIVESIEGKISLVDCLNDLTCKRDDYCAAQKLWAGLSDDMCKSLKKITLAKLAKWQNEADNSLNYVI
jgi:Rrf2 family protein